MKSEYVYFFSGSLIETNYIATKLSEYRLKYIIRDEQKSANLAGFGIPNYLFSHKIYITKNDFEMAKKICKN
tara:strand:+ start:196 stop:411 length:216 start_codon:yes stop_codon:yes gene_type:complete